MPTHPGDARTLTGDLARLRATAATRPGASLAVVAAALCTLLTFGSAAFADLDPAPVPETRGFGFPALPDGSALTAHHGKHKARPAAAKAPMLQVARLKVDAEIVPVILQSNGVLTPPADVDDVGWWDGSAGAGAERGQTVLTGHTVHGGGGVMDDLAHLRKGDVVRITDAGAEVDYQVTKVVTWSKARLARRAVDVFGQDRHHGRLVMVTCADWDGTAFESNVIAFAKPIPQPTGPGSDARPIQESRVS